MTRAEIVEQVSKETGIEKKSVDSVIDKFLNAVKTAYHKKEEVTLRGFGTFAVKHCKEKPARNLQTGAKIIVAAHDKPFLKFSKEF